jgi:hypothetical protein
MYEKWRGTMMRRCSMHGMLRIACALVAMSLAAGCADDDGGGFAPYYEYDATDRIDCVVAGDSIRVSILQSYDVPSEFVKPVPCTFAPTYPGLGDTVRCVLRVRCGGYTENAIPQHKLEIAGDSLVLKYADAAYCHFCKSNALTDALTSPRRAYAGIDSMVIESAPGRTFTVQSRFVRE